MQPLSQTNRGTVCTIKWMFGLPEALETMYGLQIREGSVIRVIQKYRDCLVIGTGERRIVIGNEVADRIQV